MRLVLCFLFFSAAALGGLKLGDNGRRICSSYGYILKWGRFGSERHLLCLKIKTIGSSTLTSRRPALLLDPDVDDEDMMQAPALEDVTLAYGFPVEDPSSGSVEGYIGDDQHFYGVLHLGNRTLHADPYGSDDTEKFFGGCESHNMPVLRMRRHLQPRAQMLLDAAIPYHIEDRRRNKGRPRARICELLLLADKEFFDNDAQSSLDHAVRRLMHAVAQADIIFRNTDFDEDGTPDNIGFAVKYILVLTSEETNTRVFGDLFRSGEPVDGRDYLMKFSRLRRLSEVCLGIAFSGNAFKNRTLGLSFTSLGGGKRGAAGGLCDSRAHGRSFNTLAIAHTTEEINDRVPERVAALTLAHELGHSFGAHHDDKNTDEKCRGYLMGSQSSAADHYKHFEFSPCSKRLIANTLTSMSYCLTNDDRPFCGNGIVEEGEACDCGLPTHCHNMDPCCTPRGGGALIFDEGTLHKEGCSVAPKAICHPSQGLCCTPSCEYADLRKSGIDCHKQDRACACTHDAALCHCGLGGRCLEDGSCHAAECALLGLQECQCLKRQTGILGAANLCGVCCLLPGEGEGEGRRCVGVEQAAKELVATDPTLLRRWGLQVDEFYANTTIPLCNNKICKRAIVRAWPVGEACITRGAVGLCGPSGVCERVPYTRIHFYPDTMNVQLKTDTVPIRSSTRSHSINLYLFPITMPVLFMLLIYK